MKSSELPSEEGTIPFRNFKTWYRIVGSREEPGKFPLVCLHGGPGFPHDYLEPLEKLASGRRVIFYDQLGCGNSDRPHNPRLWSVELFMEELNIVRAALGLNQIHLFGQSWGGMLAMEYALTQPDGLLSLIIASSSASIPQWIAELNRLVDELPTEIRNTIRIHEQAGTTNDPTYQQAAFAFYRRHWCRISPLPDCMNRALMKFIQDREVYNTMWGASEFHVTGMLKEWDIASRLIEIHVPTLITSGRYDEATPSVVETIQCGIKGSRWVIFPESSHSAHVEEPLRYRQVLNEFLTKVEAVAH